MENLTFNDILDASVLNLNTGAHLAIIDVVVALFVTLMCASIIVWTYRNTYQGVLYQRSFSVTIVLAALVTTSIIMVISGNLVLSLGMVGALSIVRFRAAIKDPLDIVYMFWAISIGIANGVAYMKVSITATILLSVVMVFMKRMPLSDSPYLLVVKYNSDISSDIINIVNENSKRSKMKSKSVKNGNYEAVYEVRGVDQNNLMSKLDHNINIIDSTLISYSNNA
jgi:uncharacterized membrane protein YhiD involved in acid resistance